MPAADHAVALVRSAAHAAQEKDARGAVAVDVSERLGLSDAFLILSGSSDRQVRAIVDAVDEAMHLAGATRRAREGMTEARWVLVDYGDIVVHVFQEEDREFYDLERLWKDCPGIALSASPAPRGTADVLDGAPQGTARMSQASGSAAGASTG